MASLLWFASLRKHGHFLGGVMAAEKHFGFVRRRNKFGMPIICDWCLFNASPSPVRGCP